MTSATRSALRHLRARHGTGVVAGVLLVLVVAVGAFAFWTTSGGGNGSANATTLSTPTGVTVSATGSTVTVGWTGVSPPGGTLDGYYVTRYLGVVPSDACGTNPTVPTLIPAGVLTCNDTGVANGTYTYRVSAVFNGWTAQSAPSASVVVNADATPPTQVVSLASGAGTAYLIGGTVYYRGDLAGTFTLSDAVTDAGSGPASALFPAIATAGWTHSLANPTTGTGSAPTITYAGGTYGWGVGATSPGTHTVTGADVQGNTVTTNLAFVSDVTGPTGGALVVNGVAGTAGGATAYSTTGTVTATRTDFSADAGSTLLSSVLRREAGTLLNGVCSAFGAPIVVAGAPSETGLAAGCYRYTLLGTDRVGNTSVLTTTVQVDATAPTQTFTRTGANSYLTGTTLYYRSNVAGALTLSSAVTDSGSGPKQAQFPAIAASGWTHTLDTVTTGTGSAPTITYTSSSYAWAIGATSPAVALRTITAGDQAGNSGTAALTFTPDATAPVTGALTLNAVAATAGGSTSTTGSGTFTGTRTNWADATSGLASSVLTREVGTLANGVCSAYAAPTTVAGVPNETSVATGCYRYTLTGTDNVGNVSAVTTVVRVDRGAPTQSLSETGANSFLSGTTLYYRGGTAGTLSLTDTVTDGVLGPKQAVFPAFATAGWGHAVSETVVAGTGAIPTIAYTSSAITWTAVAGTPPAYTVTGYDQVDNTVATALTFVSDATGPTGGALTLNLVGASAGGTTSLSNSGTFTGTTTAYTDAASGIASNVITREVGTLSNGVCSAYAAPTTVVGVPNESALATGCYRYTLTGTDNVGNTSVVVTTVQVDRANPTQVLTAAGTNAALVGSTLYFNNTVGGSFTLSDAVTDGQSGPASATFPLLSATNWTHANEVVSSGSGSVPTITYGSSAFSWTAGAATPGAYTVTGADLAGNTVGTALTFATDTSAPTGGSLVVNGVTATAGAATGYSVSGTYVGTRVDYSADTGSGVLTSVLTREVGTLLNGTCSAFGAPTTVAGNPTETTVVPGCYRYTLTGTDRVGNATAVSTVIQVDATAPTQAVTETGANGYVTGTTLYYKSNIAGSFTLTSAVTDAGSGPRQVAFPAIGTAGWTHNAETVITGTGANPTISYTSSTYSWTANPTNPTVAANRTLTASDLAGNTGTTVLTFTPDIAVPTGGALSLNATAATAGGSISRSATGTFTGARTDFTDALSGLASSVVTREVGTLFNGACGAYAAPTTVAGVPNETALATGCYRYVLTGTDNVGNAASLTTVVQVDRDNPTQVVTETGGAAAFSGGTLYYRGGAAGSFTLTSAVTDGQSGPAQALFPAIAAAGWTHNSETVSAGFGAVPTISYTSSNFSWTASPTNPTGYSVTGSDLAGNTVNTPITFAVDNTAPTGGALTVNGTGGSAGGTTSYSATGTYIGTSTPFTDAASGIASNVITREVGTLANGACSAYGAATVVAGAPSESALATGCYRYVLTGTDSVGNTATVTTVVQVDRNNPTQVLTETGGAAALNGGTLYYRSGTAGSFLLTSAVTDGQAGPASATFPAIGTAGWVHAVETVSTGTGAVPTVSYTSSLYSWTASPTNPTGYSVTGTDLAGNTVTTAVPFTPDNTGPTGGALTVNGVTATAGGATGYSTTGTYTGTRTNFTVDAGAGFASSVLTREVATLTNGACGAYGAATVVATTPNETTTAAGCYRYVLTGTDNIGNTSTLTAVIQVDPTAPTHAFSATGNGAVTGTTLYYRSAVAGSFVLSAAVTDNGSGPQRAVFPNVPAAGWTHPAETVTTGTGAIPVITYASSAYSWTAGPGAPNAAARTVQSSDLAGNNVSTALTFTADNTVPVTGALTVNATSATAGGSTSNNGSGTVTGTRTDYTDAGAGIASSVLTRAFATVTNGVCGTFGAPTTVVGNPNDTGLADGCYRYTLTGTDRVGNTASVFTTVVVDGDVPTQVVSMTGGAGTAVLSGTTVYYRPGVAGSFALSTAVTDVEGGPASTNYPAIATTGWTHNAQTVVAGTGSAPTISYASTTFSWTANPSLPAAYIVTGADLAGNTVGTVLTFVPDTTGPTGGALTVNAVTGTAGGATAYSNTGTYTGTFTNFNADAESGYSSSVLTREYAATLTNGVCGAFAAPTTIVAISETTAAAGCFRYTLTGTDLVGSTSVLSVVVQVDKTNPTMTITDTSPNAWYNTGANTMYYRGGLASTFNWTASVTDGGSGPRQVAYPAIATAGWTHAAETITTGGGAIPTIAYASSPYSWTPTPTNPTGAGRTITGSDMAGNTVAITPTFVSDTTAPTGGALTVNATAATGAGSTSTSSATSWTIGTRTDYNADTGSGFSSSVLTRAAAPWNGTTCGTYGAPTTIAGTAAQTGMAGGYCYRYVLTGTDNVGNTATLTTTVRTNLLITSVSLINGSFTSGTLNRTDTMVVQFSGPIAVSSLCSTWSGDTANQSITADSVVGVTIREGAGAANDYVQVSTSAAACGGAFNFGTVTLGNDGYLASTTIQTFRGTGANASTIAYNAATYTLTITLGINETTPGNDGSNNVNANTIATYAPGGITGTGGVAITGAGATANVRQF